MVVGIWGEGDGGGGGRKGGEGGEQGRGLADQGLKLVDCFVEGEVEV